MRYPDETFLSLQVDEYAVTCDRELGPLLLIRLHKDPYLFFPEDSWYCSYIQLMTPKGDVYRFPCYQWIEGYTSLELREGTGEEADRLPLPLGSLQFIHFLSTPGIS